MWRLLWSELRRERKHCAELRDQLKATQTEVRQERERAEGLEALLKASLAVDGAEQVGWFFEGDGWVAKAARPLRGSR